MKHYLFKTVLFFIAFFSLGLTSCSNDDTPDTVGSDFTINGVNYTLSIYKQLLLNTL